MSNYEYSAPLPPELLEAIKRRDINPLHDPDKSSVWAIGITILSIIINEDFNNYYNWGTNTLRGGILANRLEIVKNLGYSMQLCQLIEFMLTPNPEARPNLDNIGDLIYQSNNVPINVDTNPRTSITHNIANRHTYAAELEDNNSRYLKDQPFSRNTQNNKSIHYAGPPKTFNESAFNNQIYNY